MNNKVRILSMIVILVVGLSVLLSPPFSLIAQDDTEEVHKEVVHYLFEEGYNQGNLDAIDEVYAADYIAHTPEGDVEGTEVIKGAISALRAAFPDFEVTIEILIAEGDWVASRFILTGTFTGEFPLTDDFSLPPTGELVELAGNTFHRFNEEGQIVEEWEEYDNLGFLQQIGLIPMEEEGGEVLSAGGPDGGILSNAIRDTFVEQTELELEEVMEQLRDGASLVDILANAGVDVDAFVAAVVERAEAEINAAVADGRITQEQADRLLENVEAEVRQALNAEGGPPAP